MSESINEAVACLHDNYVFSSGSFLHSLHDQDRFDQTAYWQLHDALLVLGALSPPDRKGHIRDQAARVYPSILMLVIHHLDPNDGACIGDLPGAALGAYLARLELLFRPLLEAKPGRNPFPELHDGLDRSHDEI